MSAPSFASADAGSRRAARATVVAAPVTIARTFRGVATAGVTLAVALAMMLPLGAVVQIVLTSQIDDRTQTQAIIVLDPAQYWGDPAPVLVARLDHAADLYVAGVAPLIVVTGPRRTSGVERGELMARGVPSRDIVEFSTGEDTVGSLEVVAGVMRDLGWSAATIVTDPAHAARAQATASALGIDAHLSPTEDGPGAALTSEYVGRETLALLRHYLLTRWQLPEIITAG